MRIEDLVPPMKLCKQIPAGKFKDSALVWRGTNHLWWDYYIMPRECGNCRELDPSEIIAPAPTFAELIAAIRCACMDNYLSGKGIFTITTMHNENYYGAWDRNPATAALKLWLELERGGE